MADAAGFASCGATAGGFVALRGDFFAGFLAGFGAAFFVAFLTDFFVALAADFFDAFLAFFTVRPRLAGAFLAARFFATFLLTRAGDDLRTFFALRFFEAFFAAFATTNSFSTQRYQGLLPDGTLPRRFREHPKHRENQRLSFQII
jgi:hypothetical protein